MSNAKHEGESPTVTGDPSSLSTNGSGAVCSACTEGPDIYILESCCPLLFVSIPPSESSLTPSSVAGRSALLSSTISLYIMTQTPQLFVDSNHRGLKNVPMPSPEDFISDLPTPLAASELLAAEAA